MTETTTVPAERQGIDAPADLAERRAMMAAAAAAGMMPGAVRPVAEATIDSVRTLTVSPESGAPRGYLLMLHGGGYRLGRPENDARFAERLADRCGIEVVLPAYRLAPENPFPAGFNDAWKALVALRGRIGDALLLVGGDSAGGGLAAALAVHAASQGGPRIDGALLFSPWVDMTITAASFKDNADSDVLFPEASARMASDTYMQGFDERHPLASPLFADLTGFPPALINVGNGESLRDDSLSLHDKLKAAGGRSELVAIDGMEHVAPVRSEELTGSAESFEAVVAFVDGLLAKSSA
jgi:monoterpene epsilon-lactone hydrolase